MCYGLKMRGVITAGLIGILTVPFMVNAGVQTSRAYDASQDSNALLVYEQTDLSSHAELFGNYARESLAFLTTPYAFFPGSSFYKAPKAPVLGPIMDCIVESALRGGDTVDCHLNLVEEERPLEVASR